MKVRKSLHFYFISYVDSLFCVKLLLYFQYYNIFIYIISSSMRSLQSLQHEKMIRDEVSERKIMKKKIRSKKNTPLPKASEVSIQPATSYPPGPFPVEYFRRLRA